MSGTETLDRPPPGWHVLAVFREKTHGGEWTALMISVHPDELKNCQCAFPALFYVSPKEYRPGLRKAEQCWVKIPGKYRSRNSAREAIENLMIVRH